MARTGESYATAWHRVIAEHQAGSSALSAEEIRAAAAAHGELEPEFGDATVASFLEKAEEEEVAARVDAGQAEADRESLRTLLKGIAIGVAICAIGIVAVSGNPGERAHRMLVVVFVLVVICTAGVAGQLRSRRLTGRQRLGPAAVPGQDRRWSSR